MALGVKQLELISSLNKVKTTFRVFPDDYDLSDVNDASNNLSTNVALGLIYDGMFGA